MTARALLLLGGLAAGALTGEVGLRLCSRWESPALRAMVVEEGYQAGESALRVVHGTTRALYASDFQHRVDAIVVGDSMAFGWMAKADDAF